MEWNTLQAIDPYLSSNFKNSAKYFINMAKGKSKA